MSGGKSPTIRTITLHVPAEGNDWISIKSIEEASEVLSLLKKSLEEKGYTIWSTRIALPPPPQSVSIDRILDVRDKVEKGIFIAVGGFYDDDPRINSLNEIASNNMFSYIAVKDHAKLGDLAFTLLKWSLDTPQIMVRIALEFSGNREFLTPYFPITATPRHLQEPVYTIALLYPNWIIDNIKEPSLSEFSRTVREAVDKVNQDAERTAGEHGIPFAGVDASLSPWMSDSVARLLELVGGCSLESYDCIPVLYSVNNVLNTVGKVGFNEVMLPVGEDDYLKEKAQKGTLALEDLVHLTPYCLAGLDMVALTLSASQLHSLFKTLHLIARIKNRELGFRGVMLPPDYPEEGVKLERFGFIPIVKLKSEVIRKSSEEKRGGYKGQGPLIIP